MAWMTRRSLKRCVDESKVLEAIHQAEKRSSGEICVSFSRFFWGDVESAARRAFARMGMDRTAARNGVLIFVVPSRKRFAVLGDTGIHAKVGQAFWDALAATLSSYFKRGEFTEGLTRGIAQIGEGLATHFPHQGSEDRNELPDQVDFGS